MAETRYYANPRNQFWRLAGGVIRRDLTALPYPERLDALLDARIALWDAAHSAERRGSLDTAIRAARPNDLAGLAATLPELRAVAFNGSAAWRLGRPALASRADLALIALPSSSPAYTMRFSEKAERWAALARFVAAR